jgi:MHS family proline/betaine transporter-like MFS transporter
MAIAALSTVVEWYDFTLYLYMSTVLSRMFFGGGKNSLLITLAGFAVAYLMRPLGALAFGHIGDLFGRRHTLLLSIAMMTLAMLLTGLLPTYAQVGPLAGGLLLILRCVMGFSVGGEYNGVVAYLTEGAPARSRGFVASWAAASSEIGALLAAVIAALAVNATSAAEFDAWGWRIPFLAGAALAGSIWIARSWMEESPEFEGYIAEGAAQKHPLRFIARRHRAGLLRAFAVSALGSITYYVGITYVPAYMVSVGVLNEREALSFSTLPAIAVIAVTPFVGAASDYFGRKPLLIVVALCSAVLPITMFGLMARGSHPEAVFAAIVLAAVAGAVSAVGAVATAEQFPGNGRLSGLALGVTIGTAIFGGFTPYVAQLLIGRTGSVMVPGIMIALVGVCVLPVFFTMPETRPR